MKAVILAGGYGTRLFPLTMRIPKVMVPVAGKPVLEHLLRIASSAGIKDLVISLNRNQGSVEDYFGDGSRFGLKVTYVYEDSQGDEDKFGAIGAIQYAIEQTGGADECLVIGGDNVFYGLDLQRMRQEHRVKGANATLALFTLTNPADVEHYGVVQVDSDGRIRGFQEKPKPAQAVSRLASAAVYMLDSAFIKEYLPAYVRERKVQSKKPDRVGDLWAHHVSALPLYGHAFEGMWGDTNTPETYINAHKQAMAFYVGTGNSASCGANVIDSHKVSIGPGCSISPSSTIKGPCIIGKGCVVGAGAVIGPCTHLGDGVTVGDNACIHGSILFRGVEVGSSAHVTDSVVDIGGVIGPGASIEEYSMVGYRCKVGSGARVTARSRVWPLGEIGPGSAIGGDFILAAELVKEPLKKDPLF